MARISVSVLLIAASIAMPAAQSDLDALMARVLARRDDGWRKLQQYVLEERETMTITGPGGQKLFGTRRESQWFPRDGRFIKSPLAVDGVTIGDDERRRQEQLWVQREDARERPRPPASDEEAEKKKSVSISIGPGGVAVRRNGDEVMVQSAMRDAMEPGFISAAYFLRFKFEEGQYALAGRETHEGKALLRIEYYPTLMFTEGRTRPNKELRKRDGDVERKMNKAALVTMWVDAAQNQIVKYQFRNMGTDFLPAQWLLRFDGFTADMEMTQAFPGVWLPRTIQIGFDMSLAIGELDGRYSAEFYDYRLASVDTRIR
jgi:hypothetical protein